MPKDKLKLEKVSDIRNQIELSLLITSASIGSLTEGSLPQDYIEDCFLAFDSGDFNQVLNILNKLKNGDYTNGKFPKDAKNETHN